MKIPSELKIGAHTYKVRMMEFSEESCYGDEGFDPQEIRINKKLSETQKVATLFHEILGICNATMHGNDTMHALIEAQAQQLTQVLIDNHLLK